MEIEIISKLSNVVKEKLLLEANKVVLIESPIFKDNFSEHVI